MNTLTSYIAMPIAAAGLAVLMAAPAAARERPQHGLKHHQRITDVSSQRRVHIYRHHFARRFYRPRVRYRSVYRHSYYRPRYSYGYSTFGYSPYYSYAYSPYYDYAYAPYYYEPYYEPGFHFSIGPAGFSFGF